MSRDNRRKDEYTREQMEEEPIVLSGYFQVVEHKTEEDGRYNNNTNININNNNNNMIPALNRSNINTHFPNCHCCYINKERRRVLYGEEEEDNKQNMICCLHNYKRKKVDSDDAIDSICKQSNKRNKNNHSIFTNSDILCNILPFFNFSERWKFKLLNRSFSQAFNTTYSWKNLDIRFFDIDLFHYDFLKKYNKLFFSTFALSLSVDGNEHLEITINSIITHFKYLKDLRLYFRKKNTNFIYEGVHPTVSKFLKCSTIKENKTEQKKYFQKTSGTNRYYNSIDNTTKIKNSNVEKKEIKKKRKTLLLRNSTDRRHNKYNIYKKNSNRSNSNSSTISNCSSISSCNSNNSSNNISNININSQDNLSDDEEEEEVEEGEGGEGENANSGPMLTEQQNILNLHFKKNGKRREGNISSKEKPFDTFSSWLKQMKDNVRNKGGPRWSSYMNDTEEVSSTSDSKEIYDEDIDTVEINENDEDNIFSAHFIDADYEYNNYFFEDAFYKYLHNKKNATSQLNNNALFKKYIDIIEAKRICRSKKIGNPNNFAKLERLIIDVELKGEQLLCFVGKLNNLKDIIISKLLYSDKLNRSQNIIIFTCFIEKIKKNNIRLIQLGLYFRNEYKPVDYLNNESYRKILRERKEHIYNINKEEGDELMYILQKKHLSSLYCLWSNDLFISFEMYEQIKNFRNLKVWILPGWRALSLAKQ